METHCVSCNKKIEENSYSCKCGHVHEAERKWIKGKRYSVYREQIYSKLTLQGDSRIPPSARKKRKASDPDDLQVQRKLIKNKAKKSKYPTNKRRKKQNGRRSRQAFGTTFSAVGHSEKKYGNFGENYENVSSRWNFEFALDDINRRFFKQSLFWVRL